MARHVHNLLVNHIHDRELRRVAARYLHGRLIDIGCGVKPYAKMLAPFVREHVGVDHVDTYHVKSNVDLFGTAYQLPAGDNSFDCALCTAVLEHLEEPELALRECHRILKSGGIVVYTVPFIWHLHEEPRDFFRFSKYGLQYLFRKAGFEILELKALSGFWVTFGQLLVYNLHRLDRGVLHHLRIVAAVGLFVQLFSYLLDRVDKTEQWTWMYLVVASKR